MWKVFVALMLGCFVFVGTLGMYALGVYNRYIDIDLVYNKQNAKIETYHDKMWKTLKSFAQISDQKKADFKDIYVGIMEGRYASGGSKDGSLMKWIKEDNPAFTQEHYDKMMVAVEAQRNGFFNEQDIMQGIVAEGNALVRKPPANIICMVLGLKKFEFTPISSATSKEVMNTREDNDLHLFDKQ